MIKSIENQKVDVSNKRKCILSSNNKIQSENEITIPKNSSHTIQKIKKSNCVFLNKISFSQYLY